MTAADGQALAAQGPGDVGESQPGELEATSPASQHEGNPEGVAVASAGDANVDQSVGLEPDERMGDSGNSITPPADAISRGAGRVDAGDVVGPSVADDDRMLEEAISRADRERLEYRKSCLTDCLEQEQFTHASGPSEQDVGTAPTEVASAASDAERSGETPLPPEPAGSQASPGGEGAADSRDDEERASSPSEVASEAELLDSSAAVGESDEGSDLLSAPGSEAASADETV